MIRIFTTPTCQYCKLAKAFFTERNVAFKEIDVSDDAEAQQEMIDLSHQLGVPVIDVKGTIVVGFDKKKLESLI